MLEALLDGLERPLDVLCLFLLVAIALHLEIEALAEVR